MVSGFGSHARKCVCACVCARVISLLCCDALCNFLCHVKCSGIIAFTFLAFLVAGKETFLLLLVLTGPEAAEGRLCPGLPGPRATEAHPDPKPDAESVDIDEQNLFRFHTNLMEPADVKQVHGVQSCNR